jgi:cytochrome c peroxidase
MAPGATALKISIKHQVRLIRQACQGGAAVFRFSPRSAPVRRRTYVAGISDRAITGKGMKMRTAIAKLVVPLALFTVASVWGQALTDTEQLGKSIFFDDNLSINFNQACAVCHGPEVGWTGPDPAINAGGAAYEGSIPGRFGNRKPPSSAYATEAPILHFVIGKKKDPPLFVGGNFWDGRATGERLGNPAADQAQGPFLNPLEQALPDSACVVYRVCTAAYPVTFEDVYPGACAIAWPADVGVVCATEGATLALSLDDRARADSAYDQIALAIAAFEASPGSNAYTSKYDAYLAGEYRLTKMEKLGLNMFKGKGKCAACHILEEGPDGEPPLLTDFTFDNLGAPRNPDNPFYTQAAFNLAGYDWIDMGLGAFLASSGYAEYAADNDGKQKVPTLRNVDLRPYPGFVKAYGHNGYFKSLKQIVHFYNTRDAKPTCMDDPATPVDESLFTPVEEAIAKGCWPEAEVLENVNDSELGDLHLTDDQEDAIVEFMKTLSDGYMAD